MTIKNLYNDNKEYMGYTTLDFNNATPEPVPYFLDGDKVMFDETEGGGGDGNFITKQVIE